MEVLRSALLMLEEERDSYLQRAAAKKWWAATRQVYAAFKRWQLYKRRKVKKIRKPLATLDVNAQENKFVSKKGISIAAAKDTQAATPSVESSENRLVGFYIWPSVLEPAPATQLSIQKKLAQWRARYTTDEDVCDCIDATSPRLLLTSNISCLRN